MGLLEDSIREHLELKRRQGVSEKEIERIEAEAFGEQGAVPYEGQASQGEQEEAEREPSAETEATPEPPAGGEEAVRQAELPAEDSKPVEPEEAPAEPEPQPKEGADEAEDLLEETPEFLEETPEGEQLWFEQKPPKDFDFDD